MLPQWENSQLVLHAAGGTGNWIGAASALIHDDYIYLAYRDRHPVDKGRGNRAYVARSPIDDGVHFDTLCAIDKEDMDAESLERPAVDVTPEGDWDLWFVARICVYGRRCTRAALRFSHRAASRGVASVL
jgi:hypothetical protein